MNHDFVSDISQIRQRARQHMENGPVTQGFADMKDSIIKLLDEALATELVCVLRYRRHFFMAKGINSESIAQEFLQHSQEEQEHADKIATRITQLGGEPNFNPESFLERSHSEYVDGKDLQDMIREDLVAERIAIETYREMIKFIGSGDPTTRRMLEDILAVEEEHAEDMSSLLPQNNRSSRKQ